MIFLNFKFFKFKFLIFNKAYSCMIHYNLKSYWYKIVIDK